MASKPLSISASELKDAVSKALKKNAATKNLQAGEMGIGNFRPPIIGRIIRDTDLADQSIGSLQKLATDITNSIPGAKGAVPTTMVHGGHIILGFIDPGSLSILRE